MTKAKSKSSVFSYIFAILSLVSFILLIYFSAHLFFNRQSQNKKISLRLNNLALHVKELVKNASANPEELDASLLNAPSSEIYFVYLINKQGKIIAAPDEAAVGASSQYFDELIPGLSAKYQQYLKSDITEKKLILNYSDVKTPEGILFLKTDKFDIVILEKHISNADFLYKQDKRRLLFGLLLSAGMFMVTLWLFHRSKYKANKKSQSVSLAVLISVICLLLIVELIVYRTPIFLTHDLKFLNNQYQINKLINTARKRAKGEEKKLVLIPFGVYVTQLALPGGPTANLSLWLWSKNKKAQGKNVSIILPQKISGESKAMGKDKNTILVRYNSLMLQQVFAQTRYPFDDRYVTIEFWHSDIFNPNIVIYPDLKSYNLVSRNNFLTSELDPSFHVKDWNIVKSFYMAAPFNVSVRMSQKIETLRKLPPRIFLMILMRRDFTAPLVKYYLPLIIVLMMYYIGLFISERTNSKNVFGFLTYNASLLFVVTVAAAHAREQVSSNRISFIEVSYILVYFVIVMFSLLQLIKAHGIKKDKVIRGLTMSMGLAYWPIICSSLLGITLYYFW